MFLYVIAVVVIRQFIMTVGGKRAFAQPSHDPRAGAGSFRNGHVRFGFVRACRLIDGCAGGRTLASSLDVASLH